jgi:maltooligosyltrehalose trehalohydrolase
MGSTPRIKRMIGAVPLNDATHFRVWAPKAKTVDVISPSKPVKIAALKPTHSGFFEGVVRGLKSGDTYKYRLDGRDAWPDPASRRQPQGVHGPSEIVDLSRFKWTDRAWKGISADNLSVYELHVGTFSAEGTFEGVRKKLSYLKKLGVRAIELMPVADFPGRWNWGYDGVCAFAPARCYGTPCDLQRLVNAAHALGLAMLLDVVYNHYGPDGNYLGLYSDFYTSKKHKTDWGDGFNFDSAHNRPVREFFIENALQWIKNYHFDGLRLDATHAILDDSRPHFLAELSDRCRKAARGRKLIFIAEDHRRETMFTRPTSKRGWGMDAVWADDFHHQIRRRTAGDHEGYFAPFSGSTTDLAATLKTGWWAPRREKELSITRPSNFVFCIQNHDQIGNRAFGERLHHQIDDAVTRAVSTLLLLSPYTTMLFMGQEWGASSPFLYFTDHNKQLGELVVKGRRDEFKSFSHFNDPALREKIPSPQAKTTFLKSRLKWQELHRDKHVRLLRLYRSLLGLRHHHPAMMETGRGSFSIEKLSETVIKISRNSLHGQRVDIVVNLERAASATVPARARKILLSTENSAFVREPQAVQISNDGNGWDQIVFKRPGAIVYELTRSKHAKG